MNIKSKTFSMDDIQVKSGLQHIRSRPEMYLGPKKYAHIILYSMIIKWAIENAKSTVSYNCDEGICEVHHDGEGIPVDLHSKLEIPMIESIFTQLSAGGLHDFNILVILNALSSYVKVETVSADSSGQLRNYYALFEKGVMVGLKEGEISDTRGVKLAFQFDDKIIPGMTKELAWVPAILFEGLIHSKVKGPPQIELKRLARRVPG